MSKSYPKYDRYEEYKKKQKPGMYERFATFYKNSKRILKIANKPNSKEYYDFTNFNVKYINPSTSL